MTAHVTLATEAAPQKVQYRVTVESREIMLTHGAAVCWNRGGSYTI